MAYGKLITLDDVTLYLKSCACYGEMFKKSDFEEKEPEILEVLNKTDTADLQRLRFDLYRGFHLDHNLNLLHAAVEFSSEKMLEVLHAKGVYFPALMREKTSDGRLPLWDCIERSGYCLYDDPNVPRHIATTLISYCDKQIRQMEKNLIRLKKENPRLKESLMSSIHFVYSYRGTQSAGNMYRTQSAAVCDATSLNATLNAPAVVDLFKPMTVVFHSGIHAQTFFTLYSGNMRSIHQ